MVILMLHADLHLHIPPNTDCLQVPKVNQLLDETGSRTEAHEMACQLKLFSPSVSPRRNGTNLPRQKAHALKKIKSLSSSKFNYYRMQLL